MEEVGSLKIFINIHYENVPNFYGLYSSIDHATYKCRKTMLLQQLKS